MQVDAGLMGRDFFSPAGSQAVEFHSLEMLQLLTMFKPLLQHKYVSYIFLQLGVWRRLPPKKNNDDSVQPQHKRCAGFFSSGILQIEKRP